MIISRYLVKEVANALLAVTFVLLLIFLSNQLVRYLSYAASGKLAANLLFQLMGFEIPYLLGLLLPLGLYLGVILAYGRLYADSEMRVMHASGLSVSRLLRITTRIALGVGVVVLLLMLWVNPLLSAQKAKVLAQNAGTDTILNTLMPGRFQVGNDGKRVIYVEKISRDHKEASNLFLAEQAKEDNSPWVVLSAASGYQMKDRTTKLHYVVATDGYRYEGVPGQNDYKITQFKKYTVRIPQTIEISKRQELEAIPTSMLLHSYDKPANAAELQWRISIVISVLLLAALAMPLSHVQPRQGRYTILFPAILIYIIYVNLLFAARNLVEQKIISTTLGMWWVHVIILALATVLILRQAGWWRRKV